MIPLDEAYIVLVEDDVDARLVALELLRNAGAGYCYARKAADSAVLLAKNLRRVDLFLVDINMPVKSGYQFLEEIRSDDKLHDAKIVAVSAGPCLMLWNAQRNQGLTALLASPSTPTNLPPRYNPS